MNLIALGGLLDPRKTNIAEELAEFAPWVLPSPRRRNNWRAGDGEYVLREMADFDFGLDPFVIAGYSDGSPMALEVAASPLCRGLIYMSGFDAPLPERDWSQFPVLCCWQKHEAKKLVRGTMEVTKKLHLAGALMRTHPAESDAWFPHMLGATPHLPAIREFMEAI